jgi:hypothetical protein
MAAAIADFAEELASGSVEDGGAVAGLKAEDIARMMGFAPGQFEEGRAALSGGQEEAVHCDF